MRVVKDQQKEYTIQCPECEKMLAYTENDIQKVYDTPVSPTSIWQVRRYIECPICHYTHLLSWDTMPYNVCE